MFSNVVLKIVYTNMHVLKKNNHCFIQWFRETSVLTLMMVYQIGTKKIHFVSLPIKSGMWRT